MRDVTFWLALPCWQVRGTGSRALRRLRHDRLAGIAVDARTTRVAALAAAAARDVARARGYPADAASVVASLSLWQSCCFPGSSRRAPAFFAILVPEHVCFRLPEPPSGPRYNTAIGRQ